MNWSSRVVAVTGAAGFLGSHLCEALVQKKIKVYALDNFSAGSTKNIESIKDKIELVKCDITKANDLTIIREVDIVFHLAAIANPRVCKNNFDLAFNVNVSGTKNVLDACKKNCERVIFMSSSSVYGDPIYVPIDEKHPLNGKDPYAITKIIGEYLCKNYYENYGVPVTIVRNFNTFGPRQSTEYLIPTLIIQALEKKEIEIWNSKPSRDFNYVDNVVDALLKVVEVEDLVGDVVNIGSGKEIKVGELAEGISRIFGGIPVIDLKKETVGSSRLVCDNRKLVEKTGWKPKVSFEDGLEKTIQWYKESMRIWKISKR